MNRFRQLFESKPGSVLSVYFTAGYPDVHDTVGIISSLAYAGVDMIEVGIPFSDPVADGPVIQHSSQVALRNGMTLRLLFEQLAQVRTQAQVPLVLMGYINPVLQYGMEAFLSEAAACGIDGVIIPDLPVTVYVDHYQPLFEKYCIEMIFLVTPQTGADRIRFIDSISDAFIYLVTTFSTTGSDISAGMQLDDYFNIVKALSLRNPLVAGFGIHDRQSFEYVCSHLNGAIIGSAFIKAIAENNGDRQTTIYNFIKKIRQ